MRKHCGACSCPVHHVLPFCDLTCTFWLQGVTFGAGNPIALGSLWLPITEKTTAVVLTVKSPQTYQTCTRLLLRVLLSFDFVFQLVQFHKKARLRQLQSLNKDRRSAFALLVLKRFRLPYCQIPGMFSNKLWLVYMSQHLMGPWIIHPTDCWCQNWFSAHYFTSFIPGTLWPFLRG